MHAAGVACAFYAQARALCAGRRDAKGEPLAERLATRRLTVSHRWGVEDPARARQGAHAAARRQHRATSSVRVRLHAEQCVLSAPRALVR